jgi:hypothetical protein
MPVKLVVTKGRGGKVVVTLQSPGGKKLLASGPLEDRRAASGLLRSLKPVLGDKVAVDDTTKAAPAPAGAKKTAAASTKRSTRTTRSAASTAASTPAPSKKAAAAKKAPASKRGPATKKAAASPTKAPATRTRRAPAKKATAAAPAPAPTTNGVSTAPPAEETAPVLETPTDAV